MEENIKVKLIGCIENAQTIAVAGALGCFEEKSSAELLKELLAMPEAERLKRERAVLKNSFGRGHGSIGDQVVFVFSIENLPRIATLQLCLPEYAAHLQQSLRRADANRGYFLPIDIEKSALGDKTNRLLSQTFELYEKMKNAGIPAEDARFILPLYTKTNIQTLVDGRELCHLWLMSQDKNNWVPSITRAVVNKMMLLAKEKTPDLLDNFGFNYEPLSFYPSSQLLASYGTNQTIDVLIDRHRTDDEHAILLGGLSSLEITPAMIQRAVKERNEAELANLKHVHFEFLAPMSLACFHQATRQRTWNHSVESLYRAVHLKNRIVIPPSIENSEFLLEYQELHLDLIDLYGELFDEGVDRREAIGVVPHSLKVYDWIHVNGWNAIHSIGKRTCTEAQWEIRGIARKMAQEIKEAMPAFKEWAEPQCITYGKCPETKDCGYYKKK